MSNLDIPIMRYFSWRWQINIIKTGHHFIQLEHIRTTCVCCEILFTKNYLKKLNLPIKSLHFLWAVILQSLHCRPCLKMPLISWPQWVHMVGQAKVLARHLCGILTLIELGPIVDGERDCWADFIHLVITFSIHFVCTAIIQNLHWKPFRGVFSKKKKKIILFEEN